MKKSSKKKLLWGIGIAALAGMIIYKNNQNQGLIPSATQSPLNYLLSLSPSEAIKELYSFHFEGKDIPDYQLGHEINQYNTRVNTEGKTPTEALMFLDNWWGARAGKVNYIA